MRRSYTHLNFHEKGYTQASCLGRYRARRTAIVRAIAHAESVQWNNVFIVNLMAEDSQRIRTASDPHPIIMSNPNVTITYHAQAMNADTGESIACGSSVPKGTNVRYEFVPHVSEDIYWFATGNAFDSPYGDWGVSTVAPPVSCLDKDFYYQHWVTNAGRQNDIDGCSHCWFKLYAPFVVDPPAESISGLQGGSCSNPDANGNVTCKLDTVGSASATFNFGPTQGRFYLRSMEDQSVQYAYGGLE